MINFIFSNNGIVLRNELINAIAKKLDSIGWNTIIKINNILPTNIRSSTIENSSKTKKNIDLDIASVTKIIKITQRKSGLKRNIIKRLPRLLKEKDTFKMGLKIMQKTSEKGMVRLLKVAAGVNP